MTDAAVPEIFDSARLAVRRRRGSRSGDGFFDRLIRDAVFDRLSDVTRSFQRGLVIDGDADTAAEPGRAADIRFETLSSERLLGDRDAARVPVDCILWPGGLESLADVPGALARCRRLLRPDGVLIGALWGAGSLATLRRAMVAADGETPCARLHPQIDVRAMGDLMQRAGFALPVVDREVVTLRYRGLDMLVADLRGGALTNVLAGPIAPIGKAAYARALSAFIADADVDGRIAEHMVMIHFTGWAPDASQPQPARRGSATASLRDALGGKD